MKTYPGERTSAGCEVTVDGEPLRQRSDLSGNATSAFDWGFVGTGQLSLALLSDFLGDDPKAKTMYQAFEKKVIAELPHPAWTLTGQDLADALAPLAGVDGAASNENGAAGLAFGDMPVDTETRAPLDVTTWLARGESAQPLKGSTKPPEELE